MHLAGHALPDVRDRLEFGDHRNPPCLLPTGQYWPGGRFTKDEPEEKARNAATPRKTYASSGASLTRCFFSWISGYDFKEAQKKFDEKIQKNLSVSEVNPYDGFDPGDEMAQEPPLGPPIPQFDFEGRKRRLEDNRERQKHAKIREEMQLADEGKKPRKR
jgi:hypothetical protein